MVIDDHSWWHNPQNPNAFRIAKLDEDYPESYFKGYGSVATDDNIAAYCNFVSEYYTKLTKKQLSSIIEYGSASGLFSKIFKERGVRITSIDGSSKATSRERRDFRRVFTQNKTKQYDIALCTEVAEHIEPPFAGILVYNLVNESNIIWWSSAEKAAAPHVHHPNEQPLQYWKNIFDFYGYNCFMLPDEVYDACAARGRCIFYNKISYDRF